MQLTRDQVRAIVENAPPNLDKKAVLQGLISRGYELEGLSTNSINNYNEIVASTQGNQFDNANPSEKGTNFIQKARNFAVDVVGGGKLAEGLGMGLAAGGVAKDQEKAQKTLFDAQQALIKRIREKKARGEDTSRLEVALTNANAGQAINADLAKDFVDALPTDKEVIGSAVRLGATLSAGKLAEVAGAATGVGTATNFAGGAARGAASGAIVGGVEGGLQGGGLAAEANKSTEEILLSGALGTVSGAALGGTIGAVAGGIGGSLRGQNIRREEFARSLVAPRETAKVKAEAIYQGRLKDPGLFRRAELEFSKRDEQLASAIDDVVSPKATLGENIDAIRYKIDTTDNAVRSYIERNKVPFNTRQLSTRLNSGKDELELVFASDSSAEKTYDAVTKAFMREVGKKDTLGLFNARQNFDQIPAIKKLLDSQALGENARKEIVLAVRKAANEYIASLLPDGNPYKAQMLQQTHALEALGNLAEKSTSIIGKNQIQLLTEKYPILKWVVGGVVGGTIAGGVGAGSTFIGSSD